MSQQKKKILYVITKSNWGGAQRNVYDLATGLPKEDFEVLVALGGEGELKKQLEASSISTITIPHLKRDVRLLNDKKVFSFLLSLFKKERPDVVHLHSSKIGGLGALAAHSAGVPKIIFTAHGWAFNEPRFFLTRTIIWLASWMTALFSHSIITITKKDTAQARAMPFVSDTKINYIPNGIDEIKFLPRAEAREAILSERAATIPKDTIWIGTISELTKNKGLSYAIDAMAILKKETLLPFIFIIIGEGEERKSLETHITKHNLSETVFLAGHKNDARALLQAFDIFTLTSLKEGLPYVVLEAGLAGLPILATNVGGIPDIIENEKSGVLTQPKQPLEINNALKILLRDEPTKRHYSKKIQEYVGVRYSIDTMRTKIYNLYQKN